MSAAETIDPSDRPPRVALRMRLGFALAAAVIVLATAGATVGVGMVQLHQVTQILKQSGHVEAFRPGTITLPPAGKPQTILLVGSDRRFGDPKGAAHSDTLMLVRLDPRQQATTVMSIPRDLKVEIPGYGTSKVNAAYGEGGLDLTVRTVKNLLSSPGHPFKINHAIAVNFRGFREAMAVVHCVYVDVDRRYYHSNAGVPIGQRYAEINVQPGYQRLCGQSALDYVRYRHADNDLVRAARQQDFLRAAGDELSTSTIVTHIKRLVRAFARATSSDANLQSAMGILRLAHLALDLTGHPVRQIRFPATLVNSPVQAPATTVAGQPVFQTPATGLGDYVTATPAQIQRAVQRFLYPLPPRPPVNVPQARKAPAGKRHGKPVPVTAASFGLVYALPKAKALARPMLRANPIHLPFYAPRWLTPHGRYPQSTRAAPMPRIYSIADRSGTRHRAYRLVVAENVAEGQYYGIEGTTWTDPPILQAASTTLRTAGRTYELFYDGKHLRLVAWKTATAAYWVSNTLTRSLSNREMLGIARSLTRIRAR